MQVRSKAAELLYRLFIASRWHRYIMFCIPHIDTRRIWIERWQCFPIGSSLASGVFFLSCFGMGSPHLRIQTRLGPVAVGLRNVSNGVKYADCSTRRHHITDHHVPEPWLTTGTQAPKYRSALTCRATSSSHHILLAPFLSALRATALRWSPETQSTTSVNGVS